MRSSDRCPCVRLLFIFLGILALVAGQHAYSQKAGSVALKLGKTWNGNVNAGQEQAWALPEVHAGQTYTLSVSLRSGTLGNDDELNVALEGPGQTRLHKRLHAGDPDLYTHF